MAPGDARYLLRGVIRGAPGDLATVPGFDGNDRAPLETPLHAKDARRKEALAPNAERLGRTRIGIETGRLIVGDVGRGAKIDYTAYGDAINTAARLEAARTADTLTFSSVEARKLTGGTIPMEASAAGVGKLGVMLRVPYGVVGAISPFNFPLNLVAHTLGPAIAAGNAVVRKPAAQTPLALHHI